MIHVCLEKILFLKNTYPGISFFLKGVVVTRWGNFPNVSGHVAPFFFCFFFHFSLWAELIASLLLLAGF
ncbi:Uncharacterized protein APZ42_032393 [Daphnia magna]|uniref:Uncharacterized protein n=1 Tax=Daphnia magna TaxID=35525 RepID=A0A164M1F7_9CRUS|nr:Uncharacterized protein APZ42_032393 [Daphnia magna]